MTRTAPERRRTGAAPRARALRPNQRQALAASVAALGRGGRGQIVHACGSGKTVTAAAVSAALSADPVLVLLPSLALVAQTTREWLDQSADAPFDHLVVCSDDTVSSDDYVQRPDELDLDVTTDPAEIAAFLGRRRRAGRPRVVFCTYQSSARVGQAQQLLADEGRPRRFALAVCDEAHRLAGETSRDYAAVLDDSRIGADRRLFLTATPRLTSASDGSQVGMDDEDVFGPVLHRYPFADAIADKTLVDYRVLVLAYTADRLADLAAAERAEPSSGPALRQLAASVATGMAVRDFGLRRMISFHSTISAGRDFADGLRAALAALPARHRPKVPVDAAHISGQLPMSDRRDRMALLDAAGPDRAVVVSNARCLTEGVDVPALDGVVIADPRGSRTDLVQIVGRALRTAPGKQIGHVVVPVVLRPGQSAEAAMAGGAFEQVWQVVAALRDHDEDLAHELDTARRTVRLGGPDPVLGKVVISLPDGYTAEFARAVRLRLVDRASTSWADALAELEQFVAGSGHADVAQSWVSPTGFRLGEWLAARRKDVRNGKLSGPRKDRLASLGVTFDPQEELFREGLRALAAWVAEHGHAEVPARERSPDGFRLGAWVAARRRDLRAGRLDEDRRQALDGLGMVWDPAQAEFEQALSEVVGYKSAHRGTDPPQSWRAPSGRRTGLWLHTRRVERRAGRLPAAQERALTAAGVNWDPFAAAFDNGLAETGLWVSLHGRRPAARSVGRSGFPVGSWLAKQRAAARSGGLSDNRRAALDAVCPGWDD